METFYFYPLCWIKVVAEDPALLCETTFMNRQIHPDPTSSSSWLFSKSCCFSLVCLFFFLLISSALHQPIKLAHKVHLIKMQDDTAVYITMLKKRRSAPTTVPAPRRSQEGNAHHGLYTDFTHKKRAFRGSFYLYLYLSYLYRESLEFTASSWQ